ncbi:MAG: hypothetical protein HOP31_08705 [Ignavibacteria bacterium]|nr:hypothetical protein [Ignavibacteria bacterium]
MISATLLGILSKFTPKEFKEFGEFVKSPFFNKNVHVKDLYEYLKKFYPEFKDKKLDKEVVFENLFKGKKYNDGFLRTVIYNLGKLAEDYLAYVNFRKDDLNRGINLLKELNKRKLEKVFLKYYTEIEEDINSVTYHDPDYYFRKYELQNQKEIYMDWSKFKQKDFKNYTTNTVTYIEDELTSFYLIKSLNHYRFMLDKSMYEQIEQKFDFIEHIMDYLLTKDTYFKEKLKIKLHLNEVLLIKNKKEENYRILKEILITSSDKLSQSDRYSLHNILQSYCVYQGYNNSPLSEGKPFTQERFELYKVCLEQNLFAAEEHIYFDDLMFGNIVGTAISVKQFEWTEKFIEKYKDSISPENSDVVINYCYARLAFNKDDFEKALWHLNTIKTIRHIQYKLPVRDLTLMTFYELDMLNQSVYQIDSYRHFLNNNKGSLSEERFTRILNFLKFYTRLLKIKEKRSVKEITRLKEDIENTGNTLEKFWLIKKTGELIDE